MPQKTKRRRAYGSISYLGKDRDGLGRWRLRYPKDGTRKTEVVHGSRRDAEHRLAELHVEAGAARQCRVTVGEMYERYYLPDIERTKAPRTRRRLQNLWTATIGPRWSDVPVVAVKFAAVQEWIDHLNAAPAVAAVAMLRWIMSEAVRREYVPTSPLTPAFSMPKSVRVEHDKSIIPAASIDAYHEAVHGTYLEAGFILGACAGLRVGEMLGVKVGEVERREVDGVLVAVLPVLREAGDHGIEMDDRDGSEIVKTRTSRRWAVVREPYASRLLELQDEAMARGDVFLTDDGTGSPVSVGAYRTKWERSVERAGLPRVLLRNLRPTFATDAHHTYGMATEDVARLMGHSQPTMTWGVYERPDVSAIVSTVAASARK